MATSSYANLFGTTGAGRQGSKAGISTMFGQQATTGADDEEMLRKKQQAQVMPQQPTFAEMQKTGKARPAPPAAAAAPAQAPMLGQLKKQLAVPAQQEVAVLKAPPAPAPAAAPAAAPTAAAPTVGTMAPMKPPVTLTPAGVPVGAPAPATPAAPAAPTGASLAQQLQQQLTSLLQPGGYTDVEFERLKAAQEANLQAEYGAEQQRLNEELARRGLSASSIGAGRMGDLAGQQARALATMQASLLGEQAKLRQQARETGLATMSDLTRTMLTNEQAQLETRLKEQLGLSELGGVMYKRGPDGSLVPMTDAENQQIKTLAAQEIGRKYGVAEAELTGMFGGKETLPARIQRQNLAIQLAQVLAGSDDPEVLKSIMPYIYEAFGITTPGEEDKKDEGTDETPGGRTAQPRGTVTSTVPQGPAEVPDTGLLTPRVPAAPTTPAPEEEVEPKGPKKPRLQDIAEAAPAAAPAAAPPPPTDITTALTEILGQQPILLPAEEPAAVPVAAPEPILLPAEAPAPAPAPALPPEVITQLTEILGIPPILLPAEVPAEVPVEQPVALPPVAIPPVLPAEAPAPRPEDLEEQLRRILLAQQPTVPVRPTSPFTMARPTARGR